MNKKLIVLTILVLLLGIGGFFWWRQSGEKRKGKEEAVEYHTKPRYSGETDFIIEDTPGGKIIKNDKEGLTVKVPTEWNVEKTNLSDKEGLDTWIVNLSSPDMKLRSDYYLPKEGCGIGVTVLHNKDKYEVYRDYTIAFQEHPELQKEFLEHEMEFLEIDEHPALREVLFENEELGKSLTVTVPVNDKVFIFDTLLTLKDGERCLNEFDDFLKGVSIE